MADPTPSVLSRLVIAIQTFWQVLVEPPFATAAAALRTSDLGRRTRAFAAA